MKKRSVLNQRAALFAAIVALVTVTASLFAFSIALRIQTDAAARELIAPQVLYLAELAGQDPANAPARVQAEAWFIASSGGSVWYVDEQWNVQCLTGGDSLPGIRDGIDNGTYASADGFFRKNGRRWFYRDKTIGGAEDSALDYKGRVAAAVPVAEPDWHAWLFALLVSAALGIAAAALTVVMSLRAERERRATLAPIAALRDTAVSMAEGHLELRADETAEGEVGELGRAVNNLSHQLSRHMYSLIVERNKLKNLINGLSEGIVAIDADGEITHTNPALDKMFTRPKASVTLPDHRMRLIDDKTVWEDFDSVLASGESVTRNLESKDMILRLTVAPIVDELGEVAGAVGLFSDVTQMERLEKTRRDYVSNVSHELRTPLTAMRALVEPLKDGMVTDEKDRMRYYDIILREILRLSRLINDQLELSRLQSGTLSITKKKMRLDDLVYDVCDRYSTVAEEKGLKLNVETDFGACPEVFANEDRVEQMLIILLDNAIKYTETGSVSVSATWDDERVVLSVKDTGIGIDEADQPYVFDRFYKVDKAHSGKGSGLGLSIARELLKRMDEDIWVNSEKGVGTEFCFTIHRGEIREQATGNREQK